MRSSTRASRSAVERLSRCTTAMSAPVRDSPRQPLPRRRQRLDRQLLESTQRPRHGPDPFLGADPAVGDGQQRLDREGRAQQGLRGPDPAAATQVLQVLDTEVGHRCRRAPSGDVGRLLGRGTGAGGLGGSDRGQAASRTHGPGVDDDHRHRCGAAGLRGCVAGSRDRAAEVHRHDGGGAGVDQPRRTRWESLRRGSRGGDRTPLAQRRRHCAGVIEPARGRKDSGRLVPSTITCSGTVTRPGCSASDGASDDVESVTTTTPDMASP